MSQSRDNTQPIVERLVLAPGRQLALDPGDLKCGWVVYEEDDNAFSGITLHSFGIDSVRDIRVALARYRNYHGACHIQLETPKPRGQLAAAELMETLIQIGRILQMWTGPWSYVSRESVKSAVAFHGCKDKHVSQAIKDAFGGERVAVGGKKCEQCKGKHVVGKAKCPTCHKTSQQGNDCEYCDGGKLKEVYEKDPCEQCSGSGWAVPPGPLAGVTSHIWPAIGVALFWARSEQLDLHHVVDMMAVNPAKRRRDAARKRGKATPAKKKKTRRRF